MSSGVSRHIRDKVKLCPGVSFITAHVVCASGNKTESVSIETELIFYPERTGLMFTCVLRRFVAFTFLLEPKPFGGADSVGDSVEIKSVPPVA